MGHMHLYDRETDRQRDKQRERQTDRDTGTGTDTVTEIETDTHVLRHEMKDTQNTHSDNTATSLMGDSSVVCFQRRHLNGLPRSHYRL